MALPEVDVGDDVLVVKDDSGDLWRVQVKTATAQPQRDGYSAQFSLSLRQLKALARRIWSMSSPSAHRQAGAVRHRRPDTLRMEHELYDVGSASGGNVVFRMVTSGSSLMLPAKFRALPECLGTLVRPSALKPATRSASPAPGHASATLGVFMPHGCRRPLSPGARGERGYRQSPDPGSPGRGRRRPGARFVPSPERLRPSPGPAARSGLPTSILYRLELQSDRKRWYDRRLQGNTLRWSPSTTPWPGSTTSIQARRQARREPNPPRAR